MDINQLSTFSADPSFIEEYEPPEPTAVDLLNSELKSVLGIARESSRRKIELINTPSVYINQTASPAEVTKWLEQKRFSQSTSAHLQGMNAKELFNLSKSQLQQMCGLEEGKRLYHLLILQKNMSGYQTTRTLELCEKLARARLKAEQSDETESIRTQSDT